MKNYKPGQLITVDCKVYRLEKIPREAHTMFRYYDQPCFFCKKMCHRSTNWARICLHMRGCYPKLVK